MRQRNPMNIEHSCQSAQKSQIASRRVDNAFPVPAAHGSIRWHAEYEHLKCTW
jgi:hypothetical protein